MNGQELALTLTKSDIPDRVWALVYPDRTTFYLTDDERELFLKEISNGQSIIQIDTYTLSNRFSYLYQFKKKPSDKKYEEVIIDGVKKMREV